LWIVLGIMGSAPAPDGRSQGEVFTAFYAEYLPKVFRYVTYRVRDQHTAEDLTSTVFEKALAKFEDYSRRKAAFSTWIFTIARNTVIDHYRTSHPAAELSPEMEEVLAGSDPTPEESTERAEEKLRLKYCLEQLSQVERDIIALKFGAEVTNRAIASQIRLSESNVGVIVFRAVRKLKGCFGEWQHA
jgi:RNA polymerase sigma factor (sigma-70 family)